MVLFNAYPPSVHHPSASIPLDSTSAHTMLTTFLQLADLDPAYRPDSTLSERGPESNSSAGNPNLTLHHLNRIKLGLEGRNLGVEGLEAGIFGKRKTIEVRDGGAKKRKWQDQDSVTGGSGRVGVPKVVSTAEEGVDAALTAQNTDAEEIAASGEGWQDREDFELAQDDGDVDLNNAQRDPATGGEDVEGRGDEIMEWDIGGMITMQDLLHEGVPAVGSITPGATADALPENQEKNQPSQVGNRPLTEMGKKERKRLKKVRSDKEKKTARRERAEEPSKATSRTGNGDDIPIEASPRRKKQKRQKSHVEAES